MTIYHLYCIRISPKTNERVTHYRSLVDFLSHSHRSIHNQLHYSTSIFLIHTFISASRKYTQMDDFNDRFPGKPV